MTDDPKNGHASSADKQEAHDAFKAGHERYLAARHALNALKAGNERYLAKPQRLLHPNTSADVRKNLAGGQNPKICVLACADSRVPPEIIFDQGLGDMFVVRVAGNFANVDNQASLEYAVQHFDSPIIVVLGHQNCGAVQAAAITYDPDSVSKESKKKFKDHHEHSPVSDVLKSLVKRLESVIIRTRTDIPSGDIGQFAASRLDNAVCENVRDNVNILKANNVIKTAGTFIVGARYDLDTGEIKWLTEAPVSPYKESNLAVGQAVRVSQSSTLNAHDAKKAVDTVHDTVQETGAHTTSEKNAWWRMDLGASATVNSIVIWKGGCPERCGDKLTDYGVFVSDTPFKNLDTPESLLSRPGTWNSIQTSAPNPSTTIDSLETRGRYVQVQLTGEGFLNLGEVEVMGYAIQE